jgi:hypothetical protein
MGYVRHSLALQANPQCLMDGPTPPQSSSRSSTVLVGSVCSGTPLCPSFHLSIQCRHPWWSLVIQFWGGHHCVGLWLKLYFTWSFRLAPYLCHILQHVSCPSTWVEKVSQGVGSWPEGLCPLVLLFDCSITSHQQMQDRFFSLPTSQAVWRGNLAESI